MNANSFNKNQNIPNGQAAPNAVQANNQQQNQQPQPQQAVQPTAPSQTNDMPFGALDGSDQSFGMPLEFSNLDSGDVLENFDFDSFLNSDGDMGFGFDASLSFWRRHRSRRIGRDELMSSIPWSGLLNLEND